MHTSKNSNLFCLCLLRALFCSSSSSWQAETNDYNFRGVFPLMRLIFRLFFAIVVVVKSTFCQAPLSYYTKYGDTDRCVCEWIGRMNVQADLIIYSTFRCHKNQFEGFCCFWILYVTLMTNRGSYPLVKTKQREMKVEDVGNFSF